MYYETWCSNVLSLVHSMPHFSPVIESFNGVQISQFIIVQCLHWHWN